MPGEASVFDGCLKRAPIALLCLAALPALAQPPQKPPEDPKFEIRRFIFQGATLVPPAQLEEATRAFTGKDRTFGDVQRALETVERAYSRAGWSAVQVVLPEQELERGEVRFQITEARIGRVIVEGNRFFDEANIRASVPALEPGRSPNIDAIARNLRVANESPSKQSTVLLRSGQAEATVDAVVRVTDETTRRASVTLDTSGTNETGKLRLGLGYQNSNVFGRDQVLTLQYVGAPHSETHRNRIQPFPSKNVFVLGAGYRIPLYGRGDTIDITAGYSTVSAGTVANLFTITGTGGLAGIRYTQNLDKIGDYEHRIAYSLDYRGYQNKGVRPLGGTFQLVRDATVHPISVLYSGLFRRRDGETAFSFGFSQNLPGGNDGSGSDFCAPLATGAPPIRLSSVSGHNECANARYFIWRWAVNHNQALGGDWQWRFAMNGQQTRDILISGEQFGIGGADSVRGFLEREITNDSGYRGTAELYTPDFGGKTGIAGMRLRALLFADWGGVKRNRPSGGEMHAQHIGSYGFGFRLARGNNLSARLDIGTTWDQGGLQGRNESRLHGSISYIF
jgi:hemolysin activation/secretion protein